VEELDEEDEREEDEGCKGQREGGAEEEVGQDRKDMTNLFEGRRKQLRKTKSVRVSERKLE